MENLFYGSQSKDLFELRDLVNKDKIEYYKQLTHFFTFYGGHEDFWDILKVALEKK
jgi:hypothetical protein